MFSAFLFDLDGTILNSRKPFIIAYNRTLAKHGLPPLPSNEDSAIGILRNPVESIFPELLGAKRCKDDAFVESFVDDLKESYGEVYLENTTLNPNVSETLVYLKESGNKVGVVTSRLSFADYIIPSLNSLGVGELVDVVVTSKDVLYSKPSPDPYLLGAEKLEKLPINVLWLATLLKTSLRERPPGCLPSPIPVASLLCKSSQRTAQTS